jgi:hypothetical protein
MKHPTSIRWFERLYLASTLLWLVQSALTWPRTREILADSPSAAQMGVDALASLYVGVMVFAAVLALVLWYFTARGRAGSAKWLVIACFVVGLFLTVPGYIASLGGEDRSDGIIGFVIVALTAAAIAMLFRRDATTWFRNAR